MHRALGLLPFLLALAGCGEAGRPAPSGTPSSTPAAKGRLEIVKTYPGGPVFIEGSHTSFRLLDADGHTVTHRALPDGPGGPKYQRVLPQGTYHLETVERPCDGNCGILDAPVDGTRCTLDVEVRPGSVRRVTIAVVRADDAAAAECDVTGG